MDVDNGALGRPTSEVLRALQQATGLLAGRLGFLVSGQSNSDGQDDSSHLTGGNVALAAPFSACRQLYQSAVRTDPQTWRYSPGGGTTPPPVDMDVQPFFGPGGANRVGPTLSMGRDLNALNPSQWAVCTFALPGAALWDTFMPAVNFPTLPSGVANDFTQLTGFVAYAGCTWGGIYWNQGVFDGKSGLNAQAAAYCSNFTVFLAALRAVTGNVPCIIDLAPSWTDPTLVPLLSVIRAQQQLCVDTIPWCTLMSHDSLTHVATDLLHYDADSQCQIGHDVVAAYSAAIVTTSMSSSLADNPDPITTSAPLTYTLSVTNTGSNPAQSVCAAVTLPAGVAFGSGSGSGWGFTQIGQVVYAKRATMATGAAPAIVLNCTAPTSFGTGTIVTTYSIVAGNAPLASTGSQTTTLQLPAATVDATLGVFVPRTQAEFTSLGLPVPDGLNACQDLSGNLTDAGSSGLWIFSPLTGTFQYQASIPGASTLGIRTTGGAGTLRCAVSGVPAAQNNSVAWFAWLLLDPAVISLSAFSSGNVDLRTGNAPVKFGAHLGGSVVNGTTTVVGPQLFGFVYDFTNSLFTAYSKDDKIVVTFAAQSNTLYTMNLTATQGIFGSFAYFAAKAVAMNSAAVKNLYTVLGNGHWAPPWS